MRRTQYFLPTLKQAPQDADTISAKLMIRAGLVRKVASGIYEWLPLGLRVLKKAEEIVRREMDKAGCQEIYMPLIQPSQLWQESGRWNNYGKELLRIKDRKGTEFCFSPTAEEVITDLVRREVRSYRQLSFCLYQFAAKFRDEIRPRFGVMRAREFYMKDAYSFHADDKDCDMWYRKMYQAYDNICKNCGFKYIAVEADTGAIGGNFSHEFMVLANTGENEIAHCSCGYAANTEKAEIAIPEQPAPDKSLFAPLKEVHTPGLFKVEDIAEFLKVGEKQLIKTVFFTADGKPVLALVRGDRQLNEYKLKSVLGADILEKADEKVYEAVAGCPAGFAGPVGLRGNMPPYKIVADRELKFVLNGVSGANKTDYHLTNINIERDYKPDIFADIATAVKGDLCAKCGKPFEFARGIEIGHTFKLGTKYSAKMKAEFLDENQISKPIMMGCYGIGISRIVAAAIEQSYDDWGIIWPKELSPFDIALVSVDTADTKCMELSQKIYDAAQSLGLSVLWDERDERAGVKFKDADLIGLPYRIVVSARTAENNSCEFKMRTAKECEILNFADIPAKLKSLI